MKVVVTGASGTIGRQIVPLLLARGLDLLLVGRDAAALARLFPAATACSYEDLAAMGGGFDALVHMAVLNNTASAPLEDFERVNVRLALEVLESGFVHVEPGTAEELYVWPYFAQYPLEALTPPQLVELITLLTAADYEDMRSYGSYTFFRVGIAPDGRWLFFIAGD